MPRKSRILIQIKVIDDNFTSFRQNINSDRNNECKCWNKRCQWKYVRHSCTTEVQLFHVITKSKFYFLIFLFAEKLKIIWFHSSTDWRRKSPDSTIYGHLCDKTCDHGQNSSISIILRRWPISNGCRVGFYEISITSSSTMWWSALCWFYIACE